MQTRADSHRWSLCGPWSSCFVPTWHCQRIQVWEPIQHKLIECMQACLIPAWCILKAPKIITAMHQVAEEVRNCPVMTALILQTGVVGQELSHSAFAYSIQPFSYFSQQSSHTNKQLGATVHMSWQALKHKQRCCKVLQTCKARQAASSRKMWIPPYKASPSASMPH